MAAIKKKNFLNLGSAKRQVIWDQIRDEPELQARLTAANFLGMIPGIGNEIGRIASAVLRFSVGVHGVVVFLIGEDPGPELPEATPTVG